MRHLDLFSGIGGFALAASWVWGDEHEIVGFCEIGSFCQKVLKKHWPKVPIYSDIKELRGNQFDTIELVTGGFPCQPYSVAGKQQGKEDDRHLWPEMFRVIRETRPRWVIAENVPGIVNMELDQVLFNLESEGYTWEAFIIPACAVDAPHKRDRVWVVAYNGLPQPMELSGSIKTRGNGIGDGSKAMADPESQRRRMGHSENQQSINRESNPNATDSQGPGLSNGRQSGIKTGKDEKNRRMAFPGFERCSGSWWAIEPGLGRVANGIPNRVDRLKSLGNAIVPQVAAIIMAGIKEVESAF